MMIEPISNHEEKYKIRKIEINDAEKLIQYLEKIAIESNNLTFGPGEFTPSLKEEQEFISSHIENKNCFGLVAEHNNQIIGNLSFQGGGRKRLSHTGEFGVSVLKDYWGNGIAKAMIQELLKWAKSSPITKINLKVKDDNEIAINLYKKLGFEYEGRIRRDFYIDGIYYDSILMGIIVD